MENVQMTVKGNILTIVVDLSKTQGRSSSGKSEIIATTSGNVAIENGKGAVIGLNIYKKKSGG